VKELFAYGKPVTGDDLIDREEIVEEIVRNVKGGQSLILAAPRRYGKTSVILEAISRLRKEGIFAGFVDLFEKTDLREISEGIVTTVLQNETKNARKILSLASKGVQILLKNIQFKHIWQDNEIILSFGSKDIDERSLFEEALDFPEKFAEKRGSNMVMVFDEFGEIVNINSQFLKKLRAKFQRHRRVTYVFSGSQESLMRNLFTDRAQAFYGFGKIVELGNLPEKEVSDYLIKTFHSEGIQISQKDAFFLGQKISFHPYYLKILAQIVYDTVRGYKKQVEQGDIEEGYTKAILRMRGEMDAEWTRLTRAPLQRKILKIIALGNTSLYSKEALGLDRSKVYFGLTELERKGIIKKMGKAKYIFTNPLFPEYIRLLDSGELL